MICVCIRIIVCSKKIIIVRNMNKCSVDMYLQCRSCLYALPYALPIYTLIYDNVNVVEKK